MRLSKRAVTATAALLVMTLPACGGSGHVPKKVGSSTSASGDSSRVNLDLGLSFATPAGWDEIGPSDAGDALSDGPGGDAVDEIANRMGVDPKQLRQQMSSLEVFLAAPHANEGFLANINAIGVKGTLPSKGAAALQYRGIGGDDIKVTKLKVAGEDALTVRYTLTTKPGTMYGEALLVEHGDKTAILTISAGSPDETARLADGVIDSMRAD